jgi:hypothetical protein
MGHAAAVTVDLLVQMLPAIFANPKAVSLERTSWMKRLARVGSAIRFYWPLVLDMTCRAAYNLAIG